MFTKENNVNSYARRYIEKITSIEGLSGLDWNLGGIDEHSYAMVKYNSQDGVMECNPGNAKKELFKVSIVNIICLNTYICIKFTYDSTEKAYGNQWNMS
jgi:hypothetical protein